MPHACFSYPADVPASSDPRRMGYLACFSYPADPRRMGVLNCFSYQADVPPVTRSRAAAQPVPSGSRRMAGGTCFRY